MRRIKTGSLFVDLNKGRIVMTITKKHLKELADIVHMAQKVLSNIDLPPSQTHAEFEAVAREIKSFAKRHAKHFDESRWNDYIHKLKKKEDELRS